VIARANELCPTEAPSTWAAEVETLAEIGRYGDARALASRIGENDAAREAVKRALAVVEQRDKPNAGPAKEQMQRVWNKAVAAEAAGDMTSTKALFLEAWGLWRPNGQALVGAGDAAKKLGQGAEAQRLYDRAMTELELATGKKLELDVPNGPGDNVSSLAWIGNRIAIAHGEQVSIYRTGTWQEQVRLLQTGYVASVAFSRDGLTLATGAQDKSVRLWDLTTGQELRSFEGHGSTVETVAFSPDGRTLASGSHDSTVKLWDLTTGKELRSLVGHGSPVSSVTFSPDGRTLASGSNNIVRLWNVSTGQQLQELNYSSEITSLVFSPDGRKLVSGSKIGFVTLWDVATGKELRSLPEHAQLVPSNGGVDLSVAGPDGEAMWVSSVAFCTDGHTVIAGGSMVNFWNVDTGRALSSLETRGVLALSPDGRTVGLDIWRSVTGEQLRLLEPHSESILPVAISTDGNTLVSGSRDHTVRLWDLATGQRLRAFKNTSGDRSVQFSPDGRTIFSVSYDNTAKLWDLATGQQLGSFKGGTDMTSVAFSSDRRTLAVSHDRTIGLWEVATGTKLRSFEGHIAGVTSVRFSPDGRTLVSGSREKSILLWDVATGQELRSFDGHTEGVTSVAFSPDGRLLASGSDDKTARLWDVTTGKELRSLEGHTGRVEVVAFSPDGKTLASGSSYDGAIRLWDVISGKESRVLLGHPRSVVFSPNGQSLVSDDNGMMIVWRLSDGARLATLRAVNQEPAGYAFTSEALDFIGTAHRELPVCRFGPLSFPLDLCEERVLAPGLLARVFQGKDAKPEP
jgi:WD40 repeat protein